MVGFGKEIADAYIDVHGDTSKVKRDLQRLAKRDLKDLRAAFDDVFAKDVTKDQVDEWKSFRQELGKTANDGNWDRFRKQYTSIDEMHSNISERMKEMAETTIWVENERGRLIKKNVLSAEEHEALQRSITNYAEEEFLLQKAMNQPLVRRLDTVREINRATGKHASLLGDLEDEYKRLAQKEYDKTFDAERARRFNDQLKKLKILLADVANGGSWDKIARNYDSIDAFQTDILDNLDKMREQEIGLEDDISERVIREREYNQLRQSALDYADRIGGEERAHNSTLDERLRIYEDLDDKYGGFADQVRKTREEIDKFDAKKMEDTFDSERIRQSRVELDKFKESFARAANSGDWDTLFSKNGRWDEQLGGIRTKMERLTEEQVTLHDGTKQQVLTLDDMEGYWRDIKDHVHASKIDNDHIHTSLKNQNTQFDKMGKKPLIILGRLKGARNDFVNLIGVMFSGIETGVQNAVQNGIDLFATGLEGLGNLLGSGGSGSLGSKVSGLGTAMRTAGSKGAAGAVGIFAVVAAMVAAEVAASALVTAVSGVVAGIVTVSGIIADTLGGALAFALPLAGGLALAIGAIAIGIDGMNDEQKELLAPFKAWYDEVKEMVAAELFADLGDQVTGLLDAAGDFGADALIAAAGEIREAINDFIDDLGSEDMQDTLGTLAEYLPQITGSIASITLDGISGVLGIMAAIAPYASEIAEDIADAVSNWAEWANSAEGKNEIAAWFEDVWETATKVWEVLTLVWDILGELFGGARDTGQGWLDGWIEGLQDFLDFLRSPEGQQAMDDWFARAEDIFAKVGELVDALAGLWDTLDSDEGAGAFGAIIDALITAIDLINVFATLVEGFRTLLSPIADWDWPQVWENYLEYLDTDEAIQNLKDMWADIWDGFVSWLDSSAAWSGDQLQAAADWAKGIIDGLKEWLSPEHMTEMASDMWNAFVDWIKDFLGIHSPSTLFIEIGEDIIAGLLKALVPDELIDAAENLVEAIVGPFEDFVDDPAGFVSDALDNILGVLQSGALGPIPQAAGTVAAAIWDAFKPMEGKVMGPINTTMAKIPGAVRGKLTETKNVSKTGIDGIGDQFDRLKNLEGKVRAGTNLIDDVVRNRLKEAKTAATTGVTNLLNAFNGVGTKIKNKFTGISLYSTGANLMGGLARGIADYAYLAANAAYNAGIAAVKATKSATLTMSPSRAFMEIGNFLMEGLALGITQEERMVVSAAEAMAEAIQKPFDSIDALTNVDVDALSRALGKVSDITVAAVPNGSAVSGVDNVAGRQVVFEEGAVQVQTAVADPEQVAMAALDRIAARSGI